MYLFPLSFVLYPGWLHVHPWWCGEHPWEQENWLSVQDLADCAQPVGAMLGEAPQGLSPPFFTPHHAAAQPGPHTGTHWTFEIDFYVFSGAKTRKMEGTARRAAQYKIEFTGSLRVTQAPPCPPAWRSLALKPKTMGCLFVLFFFLFFVVKVMKNRVYVECFMDFTQDSVPPLVPALVSN